MKHSVVSPEGVKRFQVPEKDRSSRPEARVLQGISLVATELRTRDESIQLQNKRLSEFDKNHPEWDDSEPWDDSMGFPFLPNTYGIAVMGGQVLHGFDATRFPPNMATAFFDRIVFENPHSGVYGSETDAVQNMRAVTSNQALLMGVMKEVRGHLARHGVFELIVCGWPYLAKPSRCKEWDEGMNLGNLDACKKLADEVGGMMVYGNVEYLGERIVTRNNGERFEAKACRIRFQVKRSRRS